MIFLMCFIYVWPTTWVVHMSLQSPTQLFFAKPKPLVYMILFVLAREISILRVLARPNALPAHYHICDIFYFSSMPPKVTHHFRDESGNWWPWSMWFSACDPSKVWPTIWIVQISVLQGIYVSSQVSLSKSKTYRRETNSNHSPDQTSAWKKISSALILGNGGQKQTAVKSESTRQQQQSQPQGNCMHYEEKISWICSRIFL